MCRLFALRAREPVPAAEWLLRAPNALVCQSRCDARGRANADGWGIAWYAPSGGADCHPVLKRAPQPAYDDPQYAEAAREAIGCIVLAHVRQASVGTIATANCHPFVVGKWAFAHNGSIPGFHRVEACLLAECSANLRAARRGETDSECFFLWLLHGWVGLAGNDVGHWATYLTEAFGRLERLCSLHEAGELKLTFVASDGNRLLAVRWNNSLWWKCQGGVAAGDAAERAGDAQAVLVASEPLAQHGWRELPERSMLAVDAALHVWQSSL